ncbi:hypothetical protein BS636_06200 [Acinetobacter sp. LoGeW2-3]|uniref:DUF523 domain-containing protein n=1 Tax=Acinetobacter sp. LoGeW2-3 TaxID=1808001 RepID=UPI000C057EFA|nr:DUF523 domain-containing protein [Acinetobacter sp. LoGeW2-3]ATO19282.1 hypothetical protein BS636_06200 [Acinetobacter sp. LoGeW2-3]
MTSKRYLISACLLGHKARYDGQDCLLIELLEHLIPDQYVSLCPEVSGGLPIPRPPAEIQSGNGHNVLLQQTHVVDINGTDVSNAFIKGAYAALDLAQRFQATHAILKANSPSCGSDLIYDGSFSGVKIQGQGVTTALLQQYGIIVMTEHEFLQQLKPPAE